MDLFTLFLSGSFISQSPIYVTSASSRHGCRVGRREDRYGTEDVLLVGWSDHLTVGASCKTDVSCKTVVSRHLSCPLCEQHNLFLASYYGSSVPASTIHPTETQFWDLDLDLITSHNVHLDHQKTHVIALLNSATSTMTFSPCSVFEARSGLASCF